MRKDPRVSSQGFSPKTPTVTKNSQVEALSGNSSEVKSHATALEITDIHLALSWIASIFRQLNQDFVTSTNQMLPECPTSAASWNLFIFHSEMNNHWTEVWELLNFSTNPVWILYLHLSLHLSSCFFRHLFRTSPFFDKFQYGGGAKMVKRYQTFGGTNIDDIINIHSPAKN